VSEQIGRPAHNVRQPVMRSSLVASEGLELPMHQERSSYPFNLNRQSGRRLSRVSYFAQTSHG